MKRRISDIVRFLYFNLIRKPLLIKDLMMDKKYLAPTYYPEENNRKKASSIFIDQLVHILKHGEINEFYFLYGFDIKRFRNQEDYVPYLEFMGRRNSKNKVGNVKSSVGVLRNKLFFSIIAESFKISSVKNLAYIIDGKVILNDQDQKSEELKEYFSKLEGYFFIKSMDGECGDGVFSLKISNEEIILNKKSISLDNLIAVFKNNDFVIQKKLIQDEAVSTIYPKSINTIRVSTIKADGEIYVTNAVIRFGANGNNVDNWAQGGVFVPIKDDGTLDKYGFFRPKFGTKTAIHPDTKIAFENYKIPYYTNAIEEVVKFHKYLDVHSIGWDIAICEDGPVIIEGNDNWEVTLPQATVGFRNVFDRFFA